MPEPLDRNYYAIRAAAAHRKATDMTDPALRETLESIAQSYQRLAQEADLNIELREKIADRV